MADGKLFSVNLSLSGSVDPSVAKSIENVQSQLKKAGVAIAAGAVAYKTVKTTVNATVSAVKGLATATIEAGKYLENLGTSFDGAYDAIRIGTGATGDALQALNKDFEAVYGSVPTTMENASSAVADYNTRLGLTGPQLQEISKQALQVSDMLGDDLSGVIEGSSQAFQQWNINADDMGEAMDYVFKVSQSTGTGFTDLMNTVQQFGPQLQEIGYSFDEATALIGQLDKAGVNTSEVMSAMKKSVGALAKEGISASDGINQYFEAIQNAGNATEATTLASEIFGSKAASTMATAIRNGTLSVTDFTAELQASGESIATAAGDTYDFTERLQIMKQGLEVALAPMANTIFDGMNSFMPTLQQLMVEIVPVISSTVDAAMPFVNDFLQGSVNLLVEVLPMISQLGAALLPVLMQLMTSLLPPILDLAKSLLPVILQIFNDVIVPMIPTLTSMVQSLLPPVVNLIQAILPIVSALAPVLQLVANALATVVGWIGKIVDFGASVINSIAGLFGATGSSSKSGVNGYATGGFTSGPSIAGEDPNYPTEAVISFNPAYRSANLAYWAQAGQLLGAEDQSNSSLLIGNTGNTSVVYDVGGLSFSSDLNQWRCN